MGAFCSFKKNHIQSSDDGDYQARHTTIEKVNQNRRETFTDIHANRHEPEEILDDDFETELINTVYKYTSTNRNIENTNLVSNEDKQQLVDQINEDLKASFELVTDDWEATCREGARGFVKNMIFDMVNKQINKLSVE